MIKYNLFGQLILELSLFIFDVLFFSGDIIMIGEGYKDWLLDCDFYLGYDFKLFSL